MDINTLLMAQVGLDCTYKTMVWNLSQNVDRDTMGKVWLPMFKCAHYYRQYKSHVCFTFLYSLVCVSV
jgi:hypothetical protein